MPHPTAEELNRHVMGFDRLLGLEITAYAEDEISGRVAVRDEVRQPMGLVHGGLIASVAETLASLGTALGVAPDGNTAVGLANNTSFMRPVLGGHVNATARRRHHGRTTWVWDVDFTDDDGRLCAVTRMTIAVRPQR